MIKAGVTLYLGKTLSGKTALMLKHLQEAGGRALIFDARDSETLKNVKALRSRNELGAFLGNGAGGAWLVRLCFDNRSDYDWAASLIPYFRDVRWVIDDARPLLQLENVFDQSLECATAGRHVGRVEGSDSHGVELWICAHRPYDVHPDIRAGVEHIYCFKQTESRDLELLAKDMDSQTAERIHRLEQDKFEFVAFSQGQVLN